MTVTPRRRVTVGVLALQGAFSEHLQLLHQAFVATAAARQHDVEWASAEVRTPEALQMCDALIVPGGESTAISLVAARSGLLEPLRHFVKVARKPTWGTCAGLILLAEAANRTKKGGQELIGGLDVRVNRNHFGRQVESFETNLDLKFLNSSNYQALSSSSASSPQADKPFRGVFIRAPVVERILPSKEGIQDAEQQRPDTIVAPSRPIHAPEAAWTAQPEDVEVLVTLPGKRDSSQSPPDVEQTHAKDIVAVRQRNVFATSFHPELTEDPRIHIWWLEQVLSMLSPAAS